jgi:hypothetical protein
LFANLGIAETRIGATMIIQVGLASTFEAQLDLMVAIVVELDKPD